MNDNIRHELFFASSATTELNFHTFLVLSQWQEQTGWEKVIEVFLESFQETKDSLATN